MQMELHQFIEQSRFHLAAIKELGRQFPVADVELDQLIGETVQAAAQKEFVFILFAALGAGRTVSARHLARGTMLMPNWSYLAWAAWHMEGEVPEPLMDAVQHTTMARDLEATALFVTAAWCQEHRGGTLPPGLISAARLLIRAKGDQPNGGHAAGARGTDAGQRTGGHPRGTSGPAQ